MSKVVLLIGPSGCGKTTLAEQVPAKITNWKYLDLDNLAAKSTNGQYTAQSLFVYCKPDKFLDICLCELKKAVSLDSESHYVTAVGAGCLESTKAFDILSGYKTIAITANESEVYQRIKNDRKDNRSFECYCKIEFSSYRKKIYESATAKLDITGLTIECATKKLSEILKKI
jgi:shikimate kinase